jgi:hypothetical protein
MIITYAQMISVREERVPIHQSLRGQRFQMRNVRSVRVGVRQIKLKILAVEVGQKSVRMDRAIR